MKQLYRLLIFLTSVIALSNHSVSAQPLDPLSSVRPPIQDPALQSPSTSPSTQRSTLSNTEVHSRPETIIIEHSKAAVLVDAAKNSHEPPLELLRTDRGRPANANAALRARMALQRSVIEEEQRNALQQLRALGALANTPRLTNVRNVLNATIISGAAPGTFERLQAAGFKVSQSLEVRASLNASVPYIKADQVWAQATDSQQRAITGTGVRIGIIDTGIDYTHPDLGGCSQADFLGSTCAKVLGGYDWVSDDLDPLDEHFHGTHVAAIAAGNGTLKGVAPDASLYALRVLNAAGSGTSSDVIQAIEWSMDPNGDGDLSDHLDVINLSLGSIGGTPDSPDALAADAASDAGVVVVVAAGNEGPDEGTIGSPGTSRKAITVGAVDNTDQIAFFSSRGPVPDGNSILIKPDIVAPGVAICAAKSSSLTTGPSSPISSCQDTSHISLSGTSMATPHVAGVVALMKQARPLLTPEDIKGILKATSVKLLDSEGLTLPQTTQGAGRVDALAATQSALTGVSPLFGVITTTGELFLDQTTINGSAAGDGFESYELFYRAESETTETLIQSSNTPVEDGALGVWEIGSLPSGRYVLHLVVRAGARVVEESSFVSVRHVTITDPTSPARATDLQRMIHGQSRFIPITGRANGANFLSYQLEMCWNFSDAQGCSSDAITLTGDGLTPINSGSLGTIDISALPIRRRGLYELRLTARYSSRPDDTTRQQLYLDPTLLLDFHPDLLCGAAPCGEIGSQPTVADLNGDGKPETIYTLSREIRVVDQTGSPLPGWPQSVDRTLLTPPSVGDIDGDGDPEIIAQGFTIISTSRVISTVFAFHTDGTSVTGWPYQYDGAPSALQRYLGDFITLADITGDEAMEVLLSPIEILDGQGTLITPWPTTIPNLPSDRFKMYGGFAVADLDNDGQRELVWNATNWYDWIYQGREQSVVVVQGLDGTIITTINIEGLMPTGPVIADVNGDGIREIASFVRDNTRNRSSIFAHSKSGSILPGWPFHTSNYIFGDIVFNAALIAADLNRDGRDELITQSDIDTRVISNNNGVVSQQLPDNYLFSGFGSLLAGNVDADQEPEILFASRYYPVPYQPSPDDRDPRFGMVMILALNSDLSLVPGFPLLAPETSSALYSLALADIDGTNGNEILYPANNGEIIAFQTGGCSNSPEVWPVERGLATRLGISSSGPMCEGRASIFESCSIHSDSDLIDDCQDLCPTTSRLSPDAVCGCSLGSQDEDNDGAPSCVDACPFDASKTTPGACGCGIADTDSDNDGTPNCLDQCPSDSNKTEVGACGCGVADRDSNKNGSIDCLDSEVQPLARPKTRPRLIRKRRRTFTFSIPSYAQDATITPSQVRACVRHRSRTRCKSPRREKASFNLAKGTHDVFYLWKYPSGEEFKSPRLRIKAKRP